VLIHFNLEKPITPETDASNYFTAEVMSEPGKDRKLHPVGYQSKTKTKAQCNYNVDNKV